MSIEEYHERQRAIEAHNQLASRSTSALALPLKLDEIRRHIEAALLHIDQITQPGCLA